MKNLCSVLITFISVFLFTSCFFEVDMDTLQERSYFVLQSTVDDTIRVEGYNIHTWEIYSASRKTIFYLDSNDHHMSYDLPVKASEPIVFVGVDSILKISATRDRYDKRDTLSIDFSHQWGLTELDIHHKGIHHLNIDSLKSLRRLDCSNCNLKEMNIQGNFNLVFVKCAHNQIKHLDVSNKDYLRQLICNDNQLVDLNVANGINALFYEPFCYSKTPGYLDHLDTISITSHTQLPEVFAAFDARNNPQLTNIVVDYDFTPSTPEWLKDSAAMWSCVKTDNRQKLTDPFYVRHNTIKNGLFSPKQQSIMKVLATKDAQQIASLFDYPIALQYPIKDIQNDSMYINAFESIFQQGELEQLILLEPESFYKNQLFTPYFANGVTAHYLSSEYNKAYKTSSLMTVNGVFRKDMIPFACYDSKKYSVYVDVCKDTSVFINKYQMYVVDNTLNAQEPLYYSKDVLVQDQYVEYNSEKYHTMLFAGKDESNNHLIVLTTSPDNTLMIGDVFAVVGRSSPELGASTPSFAPDQFLDDMQNHFMNIIIDNQDTKEVVKVEF